MKDNLKILITVLFAILLSGCGSPEDRASDVIADFCDAYIDEDYEELKELTTDHQWINQTANSRKMFGFNPDQITCGIHIKEINEKKFSFIIKDEDFRFIHLAEEVDGKFKVTGIKM